MEKLNKDEIIALIGVMKFLLQKKYMIELKKIISLLYCKVLTID